MSSEWSVHNSAGLFTWHMRDQGSNSKVSIILVVLEAGRTYPSSSSYLSMSALGFEMCYVYLLLWCSEKKLFIPERQGI